MNIYIFENEQSSDFYPISRTRASFEIYCGIYKFIDRIINFFPNAKINLIVREDLFDVTKKKYPNYKINPRTIEDGVWILGNVLWSKEDLEFIINGEIGLYEKNSTIVAAKLNSSLADKAIGKSSIYNLEGNDLPLLNHNIKSSLIRFLWEIIAINSAQIKIDSKIYKTTDKLNIEDEPNYVNKNKIYIHNSVKFSKNTFFDASKGNIIIEEDVIIEPFCFLEGPLFISRNSIIKPHTQITGGVTIGPFSKIGGEISQSIIHGKTNKIHYGYLGNSYLGEWVNFGAGTTTSNLKNNYSNIKVILNNKSIDTKLHKLGSFIGDYSKTGIGTLLNTGTTIDIACNLISNNTPPKFLPPFTWFVNEKLESYDFDKFFLMLKKMQRNKLICKEERSLLINIYNKSSITS